MNELVIIFEILRWKRVREEKSNPSGGFKLREFSRCKEVSRHKIVCREQGKMEEWFALYRYKENKAGRGRVYRGGWHIVDIRNKKMKRIPLLGGDTIEEYGTV